MEKNMVSIWIITICMFFSLNSLLAQPTAKLEIGDTAPELRYSKWIKGDPIKSFDADQLYVLEFWATWCGPCKAAMPHLTQLQKQYKGKVTFIGVNVWEKVSEGKPYESSLTSVEKYVKGNEANMGYSVIADNNEQFMGNNWLKAAGENGIPSTFVVQNNQVIWIGHPNKLDSLLPKILDGSYDMQAFKATFDKRAEAGREQAAAMAKLFKPIEDALEEKEYEKAFGLMDKMAADQPNFKIPMQSMKFRVLLNDIGEKEAIDFAKKWLQDNKSANSMILSEVYKKDGLSKDTYLWVPGLFDSASSNANPVLLDAIATCYAKGGDYTNAIVYQEKALALAKKALKEGKMVGSIMDYTVEEYEQKLERYKSSQP